MIILKNIIGKEQECKLFALPCYNINKHKQKNYLVHKAIQAFALQPNLNLKTKQIQVLIF